MLMFNCPSAEEAIQIDIVIFIIKIEHFGGDGHYTYHIGIEGGPLPTLRTTRVPQFDRLRPSTP